MSGHSSLEKYTSHFIWKGSKGLRRVFLCERWVGDWTELQHIDPHSSGYNSISFPFSWAAQPGAWGPSLCWDMVLIPASSPLLIRTSCFMPTQFKPSTVKVIPWHPRPDAPVIYTGAFLLLSAWPGRRLICNCLEDAFFKFSPLLMFILLRVQISCFSRLS